MPFHNIFELELRIVVVAATLEAHSRSLASLSPWSACPAPLPSSWRFFAWTILENRVAGYDLATQLGPGNTSVKRSWWFLKISNHKADNKSLHPLPCCLASVFSNSYLASLCTLNITRSFVVLIRVWLNFFLIIQSLGIAGKVVINHPHWIITIVGRIQKPLHTLAT